MRKILAVLAVGLLVAACETAPKDNAGAASTGREVQMTPQQALVSQVGDRIFFAFDSSALDTQSRAQLDKWVAFMGQYPNVTGVIQGHCDERGTREYNLALGERRANAAKQYLVARGVPANRLSTISYGKERPLVPGHTPQAWAQNRADVLAVR